MKDSFTEETFNQWCELFVQLVIKNRQHLGQLIQDCSGVRFQKFLDEPKEISSVLAKPIETDDAFLEAYACLHNLDTEFWQKPNPYLLHGVIKQTVSDTCYILARDEESPIFKAIEPKNRFKADSAIGVESNIRLRHQWVEIEDNIDLDARRSDVFDAIKWRKSVKFGLSPLANGKEMNWQYDRSDVYSYGEIPFWCNGANDEDGLSQRLENVLNEAHKLKVDILLFPELVMTEVLERQISEWLAEVNAFSPAIRLVVAGSRHIHHQEKKNNYSNRCTVFNFAGDVEWKQGKRQPFKLTEDEAEKVLTIRQAAFEPTEWSNEFQIRHTVLGSIASPICLDYFNDPVWAKLPIDIFLVPAMSPNLVRFSDKARQAGVSRRRASTFVCNAKPIDGDNKELVLAYIPSKKKPVVKKNDPEKSFLFITTIDIDMN